jgi:hypothetical protein
VDQATNTNPQKLPTQRNNKMSTKNPENSSGKDEEFEFVNADEISFVRRGRKSTADPRLIEALKGLPKGKALIISKMKTDPKAENYQNEKSRISSQIRTACRQANLHGFRILWSPDGIPQVIA